jgi:hypothetical protein
MCGSVPVLSGVLILFLVLWGSAAGTTINVPDGQPTIQAGIQAASAGDTVLVACGTYYEHNIIMKSGVCLRSETGGADCVTIDAESNGRVVYCGSVDSLTTVMGLTITGGSSPYGGGGIACHAGCEATLRNLEISDNRADYGGGGLDVSLSSPRILDCSFLSNRADAGVGGGMHVSSSHSSPQIEGCTFSMNHALVDGGGLHIETGASPRISDCTFDSNDAERGGGVFMWFDASATFTRCTFSGNAAERGGGLMTNEASSTLTDCVFTDNSADYGAAARLQNHSSLSALRCRLSGNTAAAFAGGIMTSEDSPIELTGCTLVGNSSTYQGGAVLAQNGSALEVRSCTLSENSSLVGGGLVFDATAPVTVDNTIIAFGGQGGAVLCIGSGIPSLTCCDIFGNTGGDWVGCIAGQCGASGNISEDPLFCGTQDPGEPYTLHSNSPCAYESNPDCGLIGAWDINCGSTAVEDIGWGAIKAMFR